MDVRIMGEIKLGTAVEEIGKDDSVNKKSQLFYVQVPKKEVLADQKYRENLILTFRKLKEQYPELKMALGLSSDDKKPAPEFKRILEIVKDNLVEVLSLHSLETVVNDKEEIGRIVEILKRHDVKVIDYKGNNLQEKIENEQLMDSIAELMIKQAQEIVAAQAQYQK